MILRWADTFATNERGAVAVIAAVSMTVLVAATGVAMTTAMVYHEQSEYQRSLDAAVLSAASLPSDISDEDRIATAQKLFRDNLRASSLTTETGSTLTSSSSATTFTMLEQVVTGQSSAEVKNLSGGLVGPMSVPFTVQSAAMAASAVPVCVLALDSSSPQGIEIYGTAQFTARNCAAQANSSDGTGMRQYGSAVGRARQFGVKGGYSGTGFFPRPVTGVPVIDDPYAGIPVPPAGACVDIASKLQNTPAVLDPGTYCGGIRIMANSRIIMNPGVYVMKDGPFRIDSNSTVTGTEVTVAFTGFDSSLYLGSGAIVDLTSPKSGTYMNIQFFQDKLSSTDAWVTMLGNIKLTFDGVMYFPTQDVWIGGGSIINAKSPSYIFVTEKLWFQDNSVIEVWQENSRSLPIPAPSATIAKGPQLLK